jgi:hypothetical protein
LFDKTNRSFDCRRRVVLEAECQGEVEKQLRVGGTLNFGL